jgi:hypothetical protein
VSLLTLLAVAILVLSSLVFTYLFLWLPLWLQTEQELSATQVAAVLSVLGLLRNLIYAAGWSLLVVALFGWRKQPGPPHAPPLAPAEKADGPRTGIQRRFPRRQITSH